MLDEQVSSLLFKEEVFAIQGAIFEVYSNMGCGFLEAVYQECLEKELTVRKIPFVAQTELKLYYKNEMLSHVYKADFICYNSVLVELKAQKSLLPEHHAQVFNNLKVTGLQLGLLVHFGHFPKVEIQRIIVT